jgi:hypothetical protein
MLSGASVAHMALVQEELGSILTLTQMDLDLSSPYYYTKQIILAYLFDFM